MEDKDFDQLFKQRFEAHEVEPNVGSWQKITKALDGPAQKKRTFPSYWMAAASVIILVSAAFWLNRPAEVIQLHGKPENQLAKAETKSGSNIQDTETIIVSEPKQTERAVASRLPQADLVVAEKRPKVNRIYPEKNTNTADISAQEPKVNTSYLAKQPVSNPLKNAETTLSEEDKQVVVAQVDEVEVESNSVNETAKPRIKSIGGLVNFVIAQVDKREDKIIEFRDGEEGSEVSGINLGPLKFKSRNK